MKIKNLRIEKKKDRTRIVAGITWEECDRPGLDVFFETNENFADALSCSAHPFLVGCILPAFHHKEKRIQIDDEVCPELKEGLITAMHWIRHWYYEPERDLVNIEAKIRKYKPSEPSSKGAAFFFSGGLDCLATLRYNRLNFPLESPGAMMDGIMIYGQNIESDNRPETFIKAVEVLSEIAQDSKLTIVPVHTNIRELDEDAIVFDINHGAILGSVAHALAQRLDLVYISASDSIPGLRTVGRYNFKPNGSHPLLDPNYSSCDIRIKHDGVALSRLDKVMLLADWDAALRNIKVCGPNWPGENCGKCEKCTRTMLELLSVRVLHKSRAFPYDDVTEEMISRIHIKQPVFGYSVEDDYLELIEPLRAIGRDDLVHGIKNLIKRSRMKRKTGLKTRIRRFDNRYLNGNILKIKQFIFSKI